MQVWSVAGRFLGTGFFLQRRIVVTCAHVVEASGDDVLVRWAGRELAATVLVRDPPSRDGGRYYPKPDVAFLGVETLDNPLPFLEATPLGKDVETVFVEGFSEINPTGQVALEQRRVRTTGTSAGYLTLDDAHLVPGMSGSPVVEWQGNESIRGMLKSGRLARGRNAYVVPVQEIDESYQVHRRRLRSHRRNLPALVRPRVGEPLRDLFAAQQEAAERYPYRVATLTGREPPPLSSVYVEQRTRSTDAGAPAISPPAMLRKHRNAVIVGGPGGGKSTLIQQMVAASAQWWLAETADPPPLGRVVAVRAAAQDLVDHSWYDALARAVNADLAEWLDDPLTAAAFRQHPAPGAEWLILVDGLDELLDRDRRRKLIRRLRYRIGRFGSATRFLIATRPLDDREFVILREDLTAQHGDRLGEYDLHPFDWPAVRTFAHNWFGPAGGQESRVAPQAYLDGITAAGLGPLVEVPLLATISAIVFEERPASPLPLDRAGLYETFVRTLLTLRIQRLGVRAALREQLAPLGRQAEDAGEQMLDDRLDCLSFLAVQQLRHGRRIGDVLPGWLAERYRRLPVGVTVDHMRALLLDSGLVAAHGDDLVFIHQSFAEYLASLPLAAEFEPGEWAASARQAGADSLGLFTLAGWRREPGNDPRPMVHDLLDSGHLGVVATLIRDGGVVAGSGGPEIIEMAETAVRRAGDAATPAIQQALRAILQRTRDTARILRLVLDRDLSVPKRAEAARVLITSPDAGDPATGLAELIRLAYVVPLSDEERLWTLHVLVESGPAHERRHALQHLAQSVQTTRRDDVRMLGLRLLIRSDEGAAGAAALLRRALDMRLPRSDRVQTAYLLDLYLNGGGRLDRPPADLGDVAFDNLTWRPAGAVPERAGGHGRLVSAAAWRMTLSDFGGVPHFPGRYLRTRSFGWAERAHSAVSHGRFHDAAAWAAVLVLAGDPQEPPYRRIALLAMAERRVPRWSGRIADLLGQWVRDERQPPAVRRAALRHLVRRSEPERAVDLAGDAGLPARLRATAALALAATSHRAEARRLLGSIAHDRRQPLTARLACLVRLATLRP